MATKKTCKFSELELHTLFTALVVARAANSREIMANPGSRLAESLRQENDRFLLVMGNVGSILDGH